MRSFLKDFLPQTATEIFFDVVGYGAMLVLLILSLTGVL